MAVIIIAVLGMALEGQQLIRVTLVLMGQSVVGEAQAPREV